MKRLQANGSVSTYRGEWEKRKIERAMDGDTAEKARWIGVVKEDGDLKK